MQNLIVNMVSGWPSITSVKISSDPPQSTCYKVLVDLHSDTPIHAVRFIYSGDNGDGVEGIFSVVPQQNLAYHR